MQSANYPVTDHIPVLLTSSAVAHDPAVALKDKQQRVFLTLQSIAAWQKIRPTSPMVICDGSSYDFTDDVARLFPGALIECLAFENPQHLVQQWGRGYGEGEIVRHALEHSKYIRDAGVFAKCSAKLWVTNFDKALQDWNGKMLCKGVFFNAFLPRKPTHWHHVDTRFYVASNDFYQSYFLKAHHRLGLIEGDSLEECFKYVIQEQGLKHLMFHHQPIMEGTGGGIGRAYKTPIHRRLKEQLRLALVRRSAEFAGFF